VKPKTGLEYVHIDKSGQNEDLGLRFSYNNTLVKTVIRGSGVFVTPEVKGKEIEMPDFKKSVKIHTS